MVDEQKDTGTLDTTEIPNNEEDGKSSPVNDRFAMLHKKASKLVRTGAKLCPHTEEGRWAILWMWAGTESEILPRLFEPKVKKTERQQVIKMKADINHRWKTFAKMSSIINEEVCIKGIPLSIFEKYAMSFDECDSIAYFGAGVPKVIQTLIKRSSGALTDIVINSDYKFIVDPSFLYPMSAITQESKELSNEHLHLIDIERLSIVPEHLKNQPFLLLNMQKKAVFGVTGSYTTQDKVVHTVTYALLPDKRDTTRKTPLFSHPISFLERKFRNTCYKHAFRDVLDIELHEEFLTGDIVPTKLEPGTTMVSHAVCPSTPDNHKEG